MKQTKKKIKLWRRILLLIIIFGIYLFTKKITLNAKITIESGENVSKIFNELSTMEKFRMKLYLFTHHDIDFFKLEAGDYTFNGSYTRSALVQQILQWSEKDYLRLTILEGRSIYDIDEALARKWYITAGEYIAAARNIDTIGKYAMKYKFLEMLMFDSNRSPDTMTLEGFLYPDTYNIDRKGNISDQLIYAQLENFKKKVRDKVSWSLSNTEVVKQGRYTVIILASILEKEERNIANKPTVAGIFLKRLEIWMKLDADITLCYGLKTSYTSCTPSVIARNVSDKNNPYNTRQVKWLTPRPISNPTFESINAVLYPQTSDYLYYLHDMKGNIHYGRTLEEHNANKAQYL